MRRLRSRAWFLISLAALVLAGLLLWSALWFGLSSQCGGGYGSCTSVFHSIAAPLAYASVVGAVGAMLVAAAGLVISGVTVARSFRTGHKRRG